MEVVGGQTGAPSLFAACNAWVRRQRHPEWDLALDPARGHRVRRRGSTGWFRLELDLAALWILVLEAGRFRSDRPESMFLAIRPGWRSRPSVSRRSPEAARDRVLRVVKPSGPWTWELEHNLGVPADANSVHAHFFERNAGYRGSLRWYEANPAPVERARLIEVAREWRDHGIVVGDWQLAGAPGVSPVPYPIEHAPQLGRWVLDYIDEGRLDPGVEPALTAALCAVITHASGRADF